MATADQSAHYAELLRRQQIEQDRERDERQTIWAFLWVLFAFKAVSVGVLIYWLEWETFLYVVGLTSWPWIIIPAFALAGPVSGYVRRRRVRRKRSALRNAEFRVEDDQVADSGNDMFILDENGAIIVRSRPGQGGRD